MKFLAIVIFLAAMKWTWGLVHESSSLSEGVHVKIQQDMKSIISDYIAENLPSSQNLIFDRFWTETTRKDQLKASFIYSFEDSNVDLGAARVQVHGYAILNKAPSTNGKDENWSFDELSILDNKVEFKEALQISTSDPIETDYQEPKPDTESEAPSE